MSGAVVQIRDLEVRSPAVAGVFYPADAGSLRATVLELLAEAERLTGTLSATELDALRDPLGLLVPHAGLAYSGVVAAAGWGRLRRADTTVVILGTNHRAGWLAGAAAWERGAWRTPLGDVAIDAELAEAILALGPPFVADRAAHDDEHSIEVQLPLLQVVAPGARIVPLAVSAGTGTDAIGTGSRLGALLGAWRGRGADVRLAISSDMAHYPPHEQCARTTERLLPAILAAEPATLAAIERDVAEGGRGSILCGMCGIEPAVLGLAALRAAGAGPGIRLAAATSADAGGPARQAVGYLAVGFPAGPSATR